MALPNLAEYLIGRGEAFAQCPDPDPETESWVWILNPSGKVGAREKPDRKLEYIIRYMEVEKKWGDCARRGKCQLSYDDSIKYEYFVVYGIDDVEKILCRFLPDLNVISTPGKIGYPFS